MSKTLGPWASAKAPSRGRLPELYLAAGRQRLPSKVNSKHMKPEGSVHSPSVHSSNMHSPKHSPKSHTLSKKNISPEEEILRRATELKRHQQLLDDPEYMDRQIDELRRRKKLLKETLGQCSTDELY